MTAKYVPTDEDRQTVRTWIANGIPLRDVAKQIGCAYETMRKHFDHEISTAQSEANNNLATRLYQIAMGGNVKAIIFWLERRGGSKWIRKEQIKHNLHVKEPDFGGKFTIKLAGDEEMPNFIERNNDVESLN